MVIYRNKFLVSHIKYDRFPDSLYDRFPIDRNLICAEIFFMETRGRPKPGTTVGCSLIFTWEKTCNTHYAHTVESTLYQR